MSYAAVDPHDSVRASRTEYLAAKLLKARARATVYSERAIATDNPALRSIARIEREILQDAERSWQFILRTWWLERTFDPLSLLSILRPR